MIEKNVKKQMSLGLVISYLTVIVQFLSGIIYTPIMLSSLGQSQYGVYSLSLSFMGYLTVMNAGANAAYIRFYVQTRVKDEKKLPVLNGTFLKIFLTLSIISLIAGLLISKFSPYIFGNKISVSEYQLLKECFFFLAFTAFVQIINCVFSSMVIANEKFIFGNVINLLVNLLPMIITIPLLLKGANCVSVIIVRLIVLAILLIFNVLFCFQRLDAKFCFRKIDTDIFKDIMQFSGFIVLQSVLDQLNWQVDKFILAQVGGTAQVSLYSVGSTFNTYYIMISAVLTSVFIARINQLIAKEQNREVNELFVKSCRIFSYLVWLIMSMFVIIGHPFVLKWAGNEYGDSYVVGLLLMAPVTFSLTFGLGQDIARAKNRHQGQIFINLFFYILNVFISIPLAIKLGAIGSAFGTFIVQIFTCCIVQPIYYKKVLELDMRRVGAELLNISKGLVLPIVYGMVINYFELVKSNYVSLFFYGGIYVIIYALSMWLIALNKDEKELVNRILLKVIKKH